MRSPPARPVRARTPVHAPARTSAVTAALALLLLVLVSVPWAPLLALDTSIARALHRSAHAEPGFTEANRVLSDWVWDPWTIRALLVTAVVLLLWRGARLPALWVAAAGALGAVVQQSLKFAVGRDRPRWEHPLDTAQYAAFPSGHAMTATIVCGLLLWLLGRECVGTRVWWAAVLVTSVSVLGVGFTRLYLGVHWFTDVVAGWLLGICVVGLAIATYERFASDAPTPPGRRTPDSRS
ncbi:phosphatase PAP2 family protein [Streptomyces sp. SCSIO 30461]|uniref:phosphatase PAP2 family protein n=1 Tax=Streptomyces sp. SCSIO 30461 TaxID=3118085 RepID=UPI0030D5B67F